MCLPVPQSLSCKKGLSKAIIKYEPQKGQSDLLFFYVYFQFLQGVKPPQVGKLKVSVKEEDI